MDKIQLADMPSVLAQSFARKLTREKVKRSAVALAKVYYNPSLRPHRDSWVGIVAIEDSGTIAGSIDLPAGEVTGLDHVAGLTLAFQIAFDEMVKYLPE